MALTKNDIVTRVHELGFTKKKSVEIIESLLEIIKGTLEKGEDVLISGFGKFCVKHKKQRRGRNPRIPTRLIPIHKGFGRFQIPAALNHTD